MSRKLGCLLSQLVTFIERMNSSLEITPVGFAAIKFFSASRTSVSVSSHFAISSSIISLTNKQKVMYNMKHETKSEKVFSLSSTRAVQWETSSPTFSPRKLPFSPPFQAPPHFCLENVFSASSCPSSWILVLPPFSLKLEQS